jgi:EAL domain-containing protein (putative c-di-GMP-specific phosphodiesterase class I)
VLKIDKASSTRWRAARSDAAIARTIVALGETLQLRTVAEGIEHAEQHEGLLALGCEHGQGYLYARPLTPEAAAAFLAASRAAAALVA